MKLIVDQSCRFANMRAHTATHLLHSQLQKIFSDTKQAWSWVGDNELRFDFSSQRILSNDEIVQIEKNINDIVYQWLDVNVKEMSYQDAIDTWAKAFFEDKYWDKVRVVSIWEKTSLVLNHWGKKAFLSVELCGWVHVSNTRDIWSFVITWQEAVASWIKRISAFVWPKVIDHFHTKNIILNNIINQLWIKSHQQIEDKMSKLLYNQKELQEKTESLEVKFLNISLGGLSTNVDEVFSYSFGLIYNIDKSKELNQFDFKSIVLQAKEIFSDKVCLFTKDNGSYAIISNVSWISSKDIMQQLWRKWGWNNEIVQWRM